MAAYHLFPVAAWVAGVVMAGAAAVAADPFDPGAVVVVVVAALFDHGVAADLFDPGTVPGCVAAGDGRTFAGWPGVFFCGRFFPVYPN